MTPSDGDSKADLATLLIRLEQQLMDPVFRRNRERVSALLAEDFREFGSWGRVWSRDTILDLLISEEGYIAPSVEDFAIQRIGPETVLVTYRTVSTIRASSGSGAAQVSLRSSLWVLRESRWQVLFHQGTKVPDA
jgi:hypothetical protein